MRRLPVLPSALSLLWAGGLLAQTSQPPHPSPPQHTIIPFPNPTISPDLLELVKLEDEFQQSVAKGGGQAFATWFADDGVTLNNGQPAVLGRTAIAAHAQWDPATYQLTWYVEGAQMGPAKLTAFTWGHYDATSKAADGPSNVSSGRYITFWKKVEGHWKVALDASADEPSSTPAPPSPAPPPPEPK
jgi:ketosteroid isomerase-like protein